MPIRNRPVAILLAITLSACVLSGCGTINEKLSAGMGDYVPQWLGGLPADAPPRPGTPKYDEWMKERDRQRLEPAPPADTTNPQASSRPSGSNPAH